MNSIKVIGMDPSLKNWGIATASYNLETSKLTVNNLSVIKPVRTKSKQVRQSSIDLDIAFQLYEGVATAIQGAQAIFVEVPIGSQSARAMTSYGVCIGVLGALRANGYPFFEQTPREIKLTGAGKITATKQEMITWAMNQHPEAPWPMHTVKGETLVTETLAEHMADAIAAIHTGLASNQFKQVLPFLAYKSLEVKIANPFQTT